MDPATPTTAILINSAPNTTLSVPPSIAQAGASVAERFLEFFAANIRNSNTRIAYARAVRDFFVWTEQRGLTLAAIRPLHVAAYVEQLAGAAPTVKQHLAAIRMLFNGLVTGGMLSTSPAAAVRGPKHVVKVGKTPVLQSQEARDLLESIIIFTEHRDTLNYLATKIRGLLGSEEAVALIHGGVHRDERRKVQELFRNERTVRVLLATDAAGEGVNLQNANLMVNYDLPWKPHPEWYVFPFGKPNPSDPTRPVTTLKTAWNNVRIKAEVKGRWHDNRHTLITDLAESGAPEGYKVVSLISIGHPAELSKKSKRPLAEVLHWEKF